MQKIAAIIREETNATGDQEVFMPVIDFKSYREQAPAAGLACAPPGAAAAAASEPAIGLAAVRHAHHQHPDLGVVERIQDAVVADAELPQRSAGSAERLATAGVWKEPALQRPTDSFGLRPSDGQKVASCLALPSQLVYGHVTRVARARACPSRGRSTSPAW